MTAQRKVKCLKSEGRKTYYAIYKNENLRIFPCDKTVIKSYLTASSNDIHFN